MGRRRPLATTLHLSESFFAIRSNAVYTIYKATFDSVLVWQQTIGWSPTSLTPTFRAAVRDVAPSDDILARLLHRAHSLDRPNRAARPRTCPPPRHTPTRRFNLNDIHVLS